MVDVYSNRRSEKRVPLKITIAISGRDVNDRAFIEDTETENVSRTGACIITGHELRVGESLEVSALQGNFRSPAVIQIMWIDNKDGRRRIGVKFLGETKNWIIM
ncbi:MAG TPA: PilZ domain-containing protein [Blastocatellia bacterium]|nr:PilZ domain-containing protein [Blastocatellia bacterium]